MIEYQPSPAAQAIKDLYDAEIVRLAEFIDKTVVNLRGAQWMVAVEAAQCLHDCNTVKDWAEFLLGGSQPIEKYTATECAAALLEEDRDMSVDRADYPDEEGQFITPTDLLARSEEIETFINNYAEHN